MLVAAGINTGLLVRDEQRFPPPGELVRLSDGRDLHLDVSGTDSSGPTVILDSGRGALSPAMRHLQRALAEDAQVVSYDRPGSGWSDPVASDRDPLDVNGDPRDALEQASVDGPFIVVGHSLGGLFAGGFATSHPQEVIGIVLIDPAHEHQLDRLLTRSWPRWVRRRGWIAGMVIVNFRVATGAGPPRRWLGTATSVLEGRAAATFVVLAGVGATLASRRTENGPPVARVGARMALLHRAVFLFATGWAFFLIWPGDILHDRAQPTHRMCLVAGQGGQLAEGGGSGTSTVVSTRRRRPG